MSRYTALANCLTETFLGPSVLAQGDAAVGNNALAQLDQTLRDRAARDPADRSLKDRLITRLLRDLRDEIAAAPAGGKEQAIRRLSAGFAALGAGRAAAAARAGALGSD